MRRPPFALSSLTFSLLLASAPAAFAADAGDDWFCTAGPDGHWVCQGGEAPAQVRAPAPAAPEPALTAPQTPVAPPRQAPVALAAPVAIPVPAASTVPRGQCPGSFPPPPPEGEGDPADARVRSVADQLTSDDEGNTRLQGNVDIRQGARRITATAATLRKTDDTVEAKGDVRFRDPGLAVQGDTLHGNMSDDSATISPARYQFAERNARGQAKSLATTADKHVVMDDVQFTTCPEGREDWTMSASKVDINQNEGWGEARNMVLHVGEVPVFYFPYVTFPVSDERRSGFLWPSLGHSSRTGTDIALPYYWNIAPNYDATLTPRYMTERGLMLGGQFRYLSEASQGEIGAEFLPSDQGESLADNSDRYLYTVKNTTRFGAGFSGVLDVTDVSDDQYFHDLGSDLDNVSNQDYSSNSRYQLNRSASLNYGSRHWRASLLASDTRVLQTEIQPYELMPQLSILGDYPGLWGDLDAEVKFQATEFDHETKVTGKRIHLQPGISYPMEWSAGYVRPSLEYWVTQYDQDLQRAPANSPLKSSVTRDVPVASIDSGLVFERDLDDDGVQTLEPRLFYLYVPKRDQNDIQVFDSALLDSGYPQLFATNRFTSLDRIGDADQVTAALTSRWLAADGGERLRWSVGQIYYHGDREVQISPTMAPDTRNKSGLISELNWQLSRAWSLDGSIEWDQDAHRTQKAQSALHYQDAGYVFNLRHRFRRPDATLPANIGTLEQADVSFALPVAGDWSLVGRYNRDLRQNQNLETLGGIEYSSCCWALRIVARRYLDVLLDGNGVPVLGQENDYNRGIFVQFIFRGLAGVGNNNAGSLLERSILGYQDELGQ